LTTYSPDKLKLIIFASIYLCILVFDDFFGPKRQSLCEILIEKFKKSTAKIKASLILSFYDAKLLILTLK